jgi:hypothetical protein
MSVIFKYCDDNKMPLLDLKDIKKSYQLHNGEGKDEITKTTEGFPLRPRESFLEKSSN